MEARGVAQARGALRPVPLLLLATAVSAAAAGGSPAAGVRDEALAGLAADDECLAPAGGDGSQQCALSAAQLRAHKLAAARAAAVKPEAAAEAWAQCGGGDWKGATSCVAGYACAVVDEWYSQCKPEGSEQALGAAARVGAPHHHQHRHHQRHHRHQHQNREPEGEQEPLKAQAVPPAAPRVGGVSPIVIKGNFLYDSVTGRRFFAKGVAYNPRNIKFDKRLMKKGNCTPGHPKLHKLAYAGDPTADSQEALWTEALNAIADMGANTVRLYNIDPEKSHDKFMNYAAELGLYVIVPLTRHDWGFLPAGFPSPSCYTKNITGYGHVGTNVLTSAKLIVKQFSKYNNTLMFTVANEMTVEDKNGYAAFPCVKALTRDIHQYQANCSNSMRRIPLIYADMDMGPPFRIVVGKYLTCALESEDDAVDAYGLNVYSWCDSQYPDENGKDNFQYSPYSPIHKEFKNFAKPLLFTEFGCNLGEFETMCPYPGGRTWPDVKTFFHQFKEIMSGAIAFEFSMEDNQYGLAMTPGFVSDKHNAKHLYLLDAYFNLQKQFKAHNVSSAWDGAETTSCGWVPAKAHKMSHAHPPSKCPGRSEVTKVFKDKRLKVEPNWDVLPPTPPGADQGELENCSAYEVAPDLHKEGCCHMSC